MTFLERKEFFEQFNELNLAVPKPSLDTLENENCDFTLRNPQKSRGKNELRQCYKAKNEV